MYGWSHGARFTGHLAASGIAMVEMVFHLHAVGLATLIRGFGHKPTPLELVPWTLPSLIVSVGAVLTISLWAITATWLSTGRTRRLLIAIGVLALCNYGSVALGRAPMLEQSQQSLLRWAASARYHYSATALLAIGLALLLATVFGKGLALWARAVLIAWLTLFGIFYAQTNWRIRHYDGERIWVERILARIDAAISATPAGEPVITYNEPFHAAPNIAGVASIYVINRQRFDREVYFVDPRAADIYRRFPASPLAHIVLPPPSTGLACSRFTLQSDLPP
jgi:hypothetical protein